MKYAFIDLENSRIIKTLECEKFDIQDSEIKNQWFVAEDNKPDIDNRYQVLVYDGYEIVNGICIINYAVNDLMTREEAKSFMTLKSYQLCKTLSDALSDIYPNSETASFPELKREVAEYLSSGTVGALMQNNIDLSAGLNSAQSLSTKITALQAYQTTYISDRYKRVSQVNAAYNDANITISGILDLF